MGKLYELYVRFMVWLGADPPAGYEYILDKPAAPPPAITKPKKPVTKPTPVTKPEPPPTLKKTTPTVPQEPPPLPIIEPPAPVLEKPSVEEVEPPAPIIEKPSVEEVEPPAPIIEKPPVEEVEPPAPVLEKPPVEKVEPPAPVLEKPPVEEVKPPAPVIEKPPVEKVEPPAPVLEKPPVEEVEPPAPVIEKPPVEEVEPPAPIIEKPPVEEVEIDPTFPPIGSLDAVRALYVSYEALGQADSRQKILNWLDHTEFNAAVIDAKNEHSLISYPTQVPLAQEIGAAQPCIENLAELMAKLKSRRAYTIARLVVFKDDRFAQSYPEFAVKRKGQATLWQDNDGSSWGDPFQTPVWGYNLQLAVEAAQHGFDEILFDYLQFPIISRAGEPIFSQDVTRESRMAAITSFLSTARGQLQPFGVKVSVNIFGYACWRQDDALIGQNIERIGQHVDVLCPILYPSAFNQGIPGYKNAIAHPYEIVYRSAERVTNRLNGLNCAVRPWIQDFPDYNFDQRVYGRTEIQQQIKGCFDSGTAGFMVWNPQIQYTENGYAPLIIPTT